MTKEKKDDEPSMFRTIKIGKASPISAYSQEWENITTGLKSFEPIAVEAFRLLVSDDHEGFWGLEFVSGNITTMLVFPADSAKSAAAGLREIAQRLANRPQLKIN